MAVMLAPPETKPISGQELLAMADIGPCELIDGRYRSSTDMLKLEEGDVLTGEGVLEGFTLPVAQLFEE